MLLWCITLCLKHLDNCALTSNRPRSVLKDCLLQVIILKLAQIKFSISFLDWLLINFRGQHSWNVYLGNGEPQQVLEQSSGRQRHRCPGRSLWRSLWGKSLSPRSADMTKAWMRMVAAETEKNHLSPMWGGFADISWETSALYFLAHFLKIFITIQRYFQQEKARVLISPGGSVVKNWPAIQETPKTWVRSLAWEDPLEKGMATHSSIPAWRIPMDRGA